MGAAAPGSNSHSASSGLAVKILRARTGIAAVRTAVESAAQHLYDRAAAGHTYTSVTCACEIVRHRTAT
eukprot:5939436-Prymnesium_polylepis.2